MGLIFCVKPIPPAVFAATALAFAQEASRKASILLCLSGFFFVIASRADAWRPVQ